MIKKRIALILLFVASSIWLAHAILPHHHHNSMACFAAKHCQQSGTANSHKSGSDSHNHNHNLSTNCVLNQSAIFPLSIFKCNSNFSQPNFHNIIHSVLQYFFVGLSFDYHLYPESHTDYTNSIPTSLYLSRVGESMGLRAPPSV